MTRQRRAGSNLTQQTEYDFVAAILDTAGALIIVLDAEGRIIRFNRACERVTCYRFEEVQNRCFRQILLKPEEIASFPALIRLMEESRSPVEYEGQLITRGGSPRVISWATTALLGKEGAVECTIWIGIDITERKLYEHQIAAQMEAIRAYSTRLNLQKQELEEANAKLQALATTDGLTDLKNHRAFQEVLGQEVQRASRYGGILSLLLLDVDRFKDYNDRYGHPAGDRVLKTVAYLLQQNARTTDVVARYGGEEFAILLPNTDRFGAIAVAERCRGAIEEAGWQEQVVTASFGAATAEPREMSGDQLIMAADKALYYAKRVGRNRVIHACEESSYRIDTGLWNKSM